MGYYAKRFFGKKIEEPRDPDFVITVEAKSGYTSYSIRFREGPKDVVIDWGNGKTSESTSSAAEILSMNYGLTGNGGPGIYQIRIKGSFPGIYPNTNTLNRLISLDQWGTNEFTTMQNMFLNETKLEANYTDSPNTSNVTSMSSMFYGCTKFNGKVEFDTSNVTSMYAMFYNCREFNQEVNFNTQNVTTMENMFWYCYKFNQKVDFNSQNVTTMRNMFRSCSALVIPVKLDTSSVENILYMFYEGVAPQSFASWDVTSLTSATGFINRADINEPGNTDNYDNTLISWASQDIQRANPYAMVISFGSSKYSSRAKSARDFLVSKNWQISDGGMV